MKCAGRSVYLDSPCGMHAIPGKQYCYRHDESYVEKRRGWAAQGHAAIQDRIRRRDAELQQSYVAWLMGDA